ncbi:MAG: hypothetical protein MUC42_11480, partial [Bryobacter sp.]|nr:hypothetical protein [Bryobacter sp.]
MGRVVLFAMLAAGCCAAEGVEERVARLRSALVLQPDNLNLRKDFGYALLKAGETEAAREQFGLVWQAAPGDQQAGLEFAYLCHETKRVGEARRAFERLATQGNAQAREAFGRIDAALAAEIARWQEAARATPGQFSVHHELAQRAEERAEFALAAEQYRAAWRLKPVDRMLLVDAQRCHRAAGDTQGALIAGIAAYWSSQTRASEQAGPPERYPFVYEFESALELDPKNPVLRRELGFLLLAMERDGEARQQFEILAREHPEDLWSVAQLGFLLLEQNEVDRAIPLLEGALAKADAELAGRIRKGLQLRVELQPRTISAVPEVEDIRALADRSYEAGYLKDARRYYALALERSPNDHNLMLRLGWTSNVLKQDR